MISEKVKNITPSVTLAISSKFKEMKKNGEDVIGFGAGEPDFDTPINIKDAAKKAIDSGFTKYTESSGMIELKKAICEKFIRENQIKYSTSEVLVSNGGKQALSNIFKAVINPGDEVIIPKPYWLSYPEMIKLCSGIPVFSETNNLKITAELIKEKITNKTKAIIINTPCNPTGNVIEKFELEKIAKLAVENNILIISDEVYEHFVYNGKEHISIASLGEDIKNLTITVNAVSKTYSMTGWRLGYVAGPKEIIKAMSTIQSQETSNPCSISQYAALEAINGPQDSINIMKQEFDKRRKIIIEKLNEIIGVECIESVGSFYVFPDISKTGMTSLELCENLLKKAKVAVIPGESFGSNKHIRLSYAISLEDIIEGVKRIKDFIEKININ